MSHESPKQRVLVRTHDLFFRAKLNDAVERAGWAAVRSGDVPIAIVEVRDASDVPLMKMLVEQGVRVLAFGSHVAPGLLRRVREAGARAVPNSEIVAAVKRELAGP